MSRETGYYWIQFNWELFTKDRKPHWEPASYDVNSGWVLLGSNHIIPADSLVILKVGDKITRPEIPQ